MSSMLRVMTPEITISSTNSIFSSVEVYIKVEVVTEEVEQPTETNETSSSTKMISWMKGVVSIYSAITEVKEFQLAATIAMITLTLLMKIMAGIGVERKKKFLKF